MVCYWRKGADVNEFITKAIAGELEVSIWFNRYSMYNRRDRRPEKRKENEFFFGKGGGRCYSSDLCTMLNIDPALLCAIDNYYRSSELYAKSLFWFERSPDEEDKAYEILKDKMRVMTDFLPFPRLEWIEVVESQYGEDDPDAYSLGTLEKQRVLNPEDIRLIKGLCTQGKAVSGAVRRYKMRMLRQEGTEWYEARQFAAFNQRRSKKVS